MMDDAGDNICGCRVTAADCAMYRASCDNVTVSIHQIHPQANKGTLTLKLSFFSRKMLVYIQLGTNKIVIDCLLDEKIQYFH